jgi:hypothetical protein
VQSHACEVCNATELTEFSGSDIPEEDADVVELPGIMECQLETSAEDEEMPTDALEKIIEKNEGKREEEERGIDTAKVPYEFLSVDSAEDPQEEEDADTFE